MNKGQKSANALISKAKNYCSKGEWKQAIKIYKEIFSKNHAFLDAGHGLGVCLLARKKPLSAFIILKRTLENDLHGNKYLLDAILFCLKELALYYTLRNKWTQALSCHEECIALGEKNNDLMADYSICLLRTNNIKKSLKIAEECLLRDPQKSALYNNIGTIYQESEDFVQADKYYKKALELEENHPKAILNLGTLNQQINNLSSARQYLNEHIKRFPEDKSGLFNLAGIELLEENWERGWKLYENREINNCIENAQLLNLERFSASQNWDYIIAVHEQGLGDTFQFCRYLPFLKEYCNKIYFMGPQKLLSIIAESKLVDETIDEEYFHQFKMKGRGCWIPLMSLPLALNRPNPKAARIHNYLSASEELHNHWHKKLKADENPLIGLHWQGNPDHEFTLSRGRSIHLKLFKNLMSNQNFNWISLQKGAGSEQIEELGMQSLFSSFQKEVNSCWSFTDTAAILKCCDLVITADSGLAHLAGALGRPTWLLLKLVPEWRWGIESIQTDWYPSMRLFRQKTYGDWEDVITTQVADAILSFKVI